MAGTLFRSLFNSTLTFYKTSTLNARSLHTATVCYAARKGTRAKARAKKVKHEVTKVGFIPHNQRKKDSKIKIIKRDLHQDDSYKRIPVDNVYLMKYHRWVVYTPEEAIKLLQESNHPTMYNAPDALVYAKVELNMVAAKKTRFLDSFSRLSLLPHFFPRDEERTIMAFCKGPELQKVAMDAGATLAGGSDLIKKIQEGEVRASEYDFVIAHPGIITDLVPIRGLLKRRFPTVRTGTLDPNLAELVKKLSAGIQYKVIKDKAQENYGSVTVPIGRLNMDVKQVEENIIALLKDLQSVRPKRDGLFITRCILSSPPSTELMKIDPFVFIDKTLSKEVQADSDDEGDTVIAAIA